MKPPCKTSRHGVNSLIRVIASLTTLDILLLGCAPVKVTNAIYPREPIRRPTALHFYTEARVYEDCTEELAMLEERVAKISDSLNTLPELKLGPCRRDCPGAMTVRAVITHISKVSELGNALYGGNEVRLSVELTESDTGKKLAVFEINAANATPVHLMYPCAWRIIEQLEKIFPAAPPEQSD